MKAEYDFNNAEQGRFHEPEAAFNLPVYLDEEVMTFVQGIAERQGTDTSSVVNELLRSDMRLAEVMK